MTYSMMGLRLFLLLCALTSLGNWASGTRMVPTASMPSDQPKHHQQQQQQQPATNERKPIRDVVILGERHSGTNFLFKAMQTLLVTTNATELNDEGSNGSPPSPSSTDTWAVRVIDRFLARKCLLRKLACR